MTARDAESRGAPEAPAIIKAVAGICRAFGMRVVTEGIETSTQHSHLKAAGVHAIQGYLFGKPVTAAEYAELIAAAQAKGTLQPARRGAA